MNTNHRRALAAGLAAAAISLCAIGAVPAAAATKPASQAASISTHHRASGGQQVPGRPDLGAVPAPPTTHPAAAQASGTGSARTNSSAHTSPANDVISGISLTVTNSTTSPVAVTFMYEGQPGGQANWTWLNPGQSTTASNSTVSGPDIYNSYLYFSDTAKQVKFESKLAAWTANTTITVNGDETELGRGARVTKSTEGHTYAAARAATDITLPILDWVDGQPTVRPDMGLTLTGRI